MNSNDYREVVRLVARSIAIGKEDKELQCGLLLAV